MSEYFEQGRADCQALYISKQYAWVERSIAAEDAMKLFLPPVENQMVMFSLPYPKPVQEWIAGFNEERIKFVGDGVVRQD